MSPTIYTRLLCLILLVVISNVQSSAWCHANTGSACESLAECQKYTYYTMALQDFCNKGYWSLHGLWPNFSSSCWPEDCSSTQWSNVTGELEEEMSIYWSCVDILYPSDPPQWAWKHEWDKHGTCMQYYDSTLTQTEYFNIALEQFHLKTNDGSIEEKCDTPTNDSNSCYLLCVDLKFNVVECETQADVVVQYTSTFSVVFIILLCICVW
eukprot:UN04930